MIHIWEHLLHYMENTTYENAVNEDLREIHRMVETVKKDPEVGGMRIQIIEELYELKQENIKLTEDARQAEEKNTRQAEEIAKLAEEIAKLREELDRSTAMEKAADNS